MSSITFFQGNIPAIYDHYLGPLLFEPYALDLEERLKKEKLNNVLEIACGTGRVTRHLASLLPPDGKLLATDLNADMIVLAKAKVQDKRIQWETVNAQELPYKNDSFDHVLCQFGVMFFPDKEKAFSEAFRVLQSGGKFLFNTWDKLEWNPNTALIHNVMVDMFKEHAPDFISKGPFSFHNLDEIRRLLDKAGFKNIKLEIVQKTTQYGDIDDFIKGFTEGTSLSAYLKGIDADDRAELNKRLHEETIRQFEPDRLVPTQALVCEGTK
jgi:ubiquinone/menaquinone biosynthesis C-methylase UbiE